MLSEERPVTGFVGACELWRHNAALRDCTLSEVFVHLCSAAQWTAITGEVPPPTPVDRDAYVSAGLPWFDYYDADVRDLAASTILSKVETVGDTLGTEDGPFVSVDPKTVISLGDSSPDPVAEGTW